VIYSHFVWFLREEQKIVERFFYSNGSFDKK
jgi:hypothetical protein